MQLFNASKEHHSWAACPLVRCPAACWGRENHSFLRRSYMISGTLHVLCNSRNEAYILQRVATCCRAASTISQQRVGRAAASCKATHRHTQHFVMYLLLEVMIQFSASAYCTAPQAINVTWLSAPIAVSYCLVCCIA